MKKRILPLLLATAMMLTGCGFWDGSYVSVTPHHEQRQTGQSPAISAGTYLDLMGALTQMIASGTESATIIVAEYPENAVETGMKVAVRYVMENDAIGAYAVESIDYTLGANGGQPAVAVKINYRHTLAEIRRIQVIETMEQMQPIIARALEFYETGVVVRASNYIPTDFSQIVEDLAEINPHLVMELPQVSAGIYGTGRQRVVELNFTYQTGRDSLRQMKAQVKPVFDAAVLYVSGDGSQWQKYSQLYAFLMERFDYTLETSITPAYSLLHHGVGDSRAFATVYAAMCRAAGLECEIVRGTRSGEPWTWNMVCDNGLYYHVDLLRCNEQGRYSEKTDAQMQGYVWDYSAYPACTGAQEPVETESYAPPETAAGETEEPLTEPRE